MIINEKSEHVGQEVTTSQIQTIHDTKKAHSIKQWHSKPHITFPELPRLLSGCCFQLWSSFRSSEPSRCVGLENKIILLMLKERLGCFTLTFDQNNSPYKEFDDPLLNIFPEDRARESKQVHSEGFWQAIWKHFDTTKINKC